MRAAIVAAVLVSSVGIVAVPAEAQSSTDCQPTDSPTGVYCQVGWESSHWEPAAFCQLTEDRTGVYCHAELYKTCFSDHWITLEDGQEEFTYCH